MLYHHHHHHHHPHRPHRLFDAIEQYSAIDHEQTTVKTKESLDVALWYTSDF